MNELSYYILDIIQNSIDAQSKNILVKISEDKDLLEIEISDDGIGMSCEELKICTDPFYTNKYNKKIGFGLSFFKELCLQTDGKFLINSFKNKGTKVKATFNINSYNMLSFGDIIQTLLTVFFTTTIDYVFIYNYKSSLFKTQQMYIDSKEIKIKFGSDVFTNIYFYDFFRKFLTQELNKIDSKFLKY